MKFPLSISIAIGQTDNIVIGIVISPGHAAAESDSLMGPLGIVFDAFGG